MEYHFDKIHHIDKIFITGCTRSCQTSGAASDENSVNMMTFRFQFLALCKETVDQSSKPTSTHWRAMLMFQVTGPLQCIRVYIALQTGFGGWTANWDYCKTWTPRYIYIYNIYWGWDKMDNISQTTFSNIFSSMKIFEFLLKFHWNLFLRAQLTHWGRVTHICVVKLTIIGSDNGLSPGRHQAIIWTNARILLIGPIGTNFIENFIGIQTFSFKKMHLKMSSAKWRPFCLGLNVLTIFQHWFK